MMNDKEVGKLWQIVYRPRAMPPPHIEDVRNLIRKLVEERKKEYLGAYDGSAERHRKALKKALRDFGIDPATWKEEPK